MVLLLSLGAALAFGVSDFVAGALTRRAGVWPVAIASQGAAAALVACAAAVHPGDLRAAPLAWGALAGLGSGAGNFFLYRGLGTGSMAVVAPLSAVAGAGLPVLVGFLAGERPGPLPLAGVIAALPAIWLVSTSGAGLRGARWSDVAHGLLAGAGFALQLSALGQVPRDSGLVPAALCQSVSVTAILAAALALGAPWRPRDRAGRLGAGAGLLAGAATLSFQLAAQRGLLSIASVVACLYPAVTVVLAAAVLRERTGKAQAVGLALATAAVALIASG